MIKYIHINGGVEFMNILIVEDERDIRNLISLHMRKENYEVYEASDGREALNIFENEKIDLILLDIMMPNVDGFQLYKRYEPSLLFL